MHHLLACAMSASLMGEVLVADLPNSTRAANAMSLAPSVADVPSIRFVGDPKLVRAYGDPELGSIKYIRVATRVQVNMPAGSRASGVPVILTVLSDAGVFSKANAITAGNGYADLTASFGTSLGSLRVVAQACVGRYENAQSTVPTTACTLEVPLSLRKWVSLDSSLNFGYAFAVQRAPSGARTAELANSIQGVIIPKLQVNIIESEENWKYYRVGIYGSVPVVAARQRLDYLGAAGNPVPRFTNTYGLGDYAAGVNMYLLRSVLIDVAYNGRSGKVNLVDSFRNLSSPGALNLGDGFESIDSTLYVSKTFNGGSLFPFALGYNSHPFIRHLLNGDMAKRGDFTQGLGGIGFVLSGHRAALLLWGGYQRYDTIRVTSRGATHVLFNRQDQWLAGCTAVPITSPRISYQAGVVAGGSGTQGGYVAVTLTMSLRIL